MINVFLDQSDDHIAPVMVDLHSFGERFWDGDSPRGLFLAADAVHAMRFVRNLHILNSIENVQRLSKL